MKPRAQEPAHEAQLCLPRGHSALVEAGSCSLEDRAGPGLPRGRRRLNETGLCPQPLPACSGLAKALVWPPGVDQSCVWAPCRVCRGLPCPGPLCPAQRTCARLRGPALPPPPRAAGPPDPGVQLLTSCSVAMATWQAEGAGGVRGGLAALPVAGVVKPKPRGRMIWPESSYKYGNQSINKVWLFH